MVLTDLLTNHYLAEKRTASTGAGGREIYRHQLLEKSRLPSRRLLNFHHEIRQCME